MQHAESASIHSSILGNHDAMPPPAVLAKREHEFTPVPFLLEVKGSIVQFHLFEYEMSREFVRGKSWGHEPKPNPLFRTFVLFLNAKTGVTSGKE